MNYEKGSILGVFGIAECANMIFEFQISVIQGGRANMVDAEALKIKTSSNIQETHNIGIFDDTFLDSEVKNSIFKIAYPI